MTMLLKGARVLDPLQNLDEVRDVLIEGNRITAVKKKISSKAGEVFDLAGKLLCPGWVDLHVHLREPGGEYKETIETGTLAAVAGGFTDVLCMPNTSPTIDNRSTVDFVNKRARETAHCRVHVAGAIHKGLQGECMASIGEMAAVGIRAVSDDGEGTADSHLLRKCLEYARMFDLPFVAHCEDRTLTAEGVANEGDVGTELGLPPIPREAEETHIFRNVAIARLAACHVHIAHVSTAGGVEIIRRAKDDGLKVTAEATPHHFTLTEECIRGFGTDFKMSPPLRTQQDVDAIRDGLAGGVIDAIATDHAPHAEEEKEVEFGAAPFGIVGLETAAPLSMALVRDGVLSHLQMVETLSVNPRRILGLPCEGICESAPADLTVIDPDLTLTLRPEDLHSKSRNSPFLGTKLTGFAYLTIVDGKVVFERAASPEEAAVGG